VLSVLARERGESHAEGVVAKTQRREDRKAKGENRRSIRKTIYCFCSVFLRPSVFICGFQGLVRKLQPLMNADSHRAIQR